MSQAKPDNRSQEYLIPQRDNHYHSVYRICIFSANFTFNKHIPSIDGCCSSFYVSDSIALAVWATLHFSWHPVRALCNAGFFLLHVNWISSLTLGAKVFRARKADTVDILTRPTAIRIHINFNSILLLRR